MSADVRSDEELMHAYLAGEKNAIAILLERRRDWMWVAIAPEGTRSHNLARTVITGAGDATALTVNTNDFCATEFWMETASRELAEERAAAYAAYSAEQAKKKAAKEAVDAAFFAGTKVKSNFISTLGYGDPATIFERSPRPGFDRFNTIS